MYAKMRLKIKYSRRAKRRLKYITSVQVEHVLEYGKFAPPSSFTQTAFVYFLQNTILSLNFLILMKMALLLLNLNTQ